MQTVRHTPLTSRLAKLWLPLMPLEECTPISTGTGVAVAGVAASGAQTVASEELFAPTGKQLSDVRFLRERALPGAAPAAAPNGETAAAGGLGSPSHPTET
eukprot:3838420-Prymnesium_polylepis.1